MVFADQCQQHPQDRGGLSGTGSAGQDKKTATEHLHDRLRLRAYGFGIGGLEQGLQIIRFTGHPRHFDMTSACAQIGRDSDFMQGIAAQIEMIELKHKWRGHHRIFGQRGDHRFSTQCLDLGGTQCAKPMT